MKHPAFPLNMHVNEVWSQSCKAYRILIGATVVLSRVQKYGGFGWSRSDLGSDPYGKRSEESPRCDSIRDDGAYAYEGGKVKQYGARGTAPKSSTWAPTFDDYGRSIGFGSEKDSTVTSNSSKIVRVVPKAETQQDVKSGVQKFRVKLLPESLGQNTMDVLCQMLRDSCID
ncbi:protein free1 [Quercus suber]|uniref:Protein free1 n=1 Tax=Quercus suber TaxID=58331 RepID=A0AAW0K7L2_QUESU